MEGGAGELRVTAALRVLRVSFFLFLICSFGPVWSSGPRHRFCPMGVLRPLEPLGPLGPMVRGSLPASDTLSPLGPIAPWVSVLCCVELC